MIYLKAGEMAEVDKEVVEKYGLRINQMMENAGRNMARFVFDKLKPKKVVVLYGKGNNGGDGLAAARHLAIYGCNVEIIPASEGGNEQVIHQTKILENMGITLKEDFTEADVVIDALLGYNIKGNPRERYAELIAKANEAKKEGAKIVSFDLPSGMNPDTGEKSVPCVQSDYTLTLALPKAGLQIGEAGELYLVNIGIPNELYEEMGLEVENYFAEADVVRV